MKTKDIQFIMRVFFYCWLIAAIYIRVDWTVALFAFLVMVRVEIEDYFSKK